MLNLKKYQFKVIEYRYKGKRIGTRTEFYDIVSIDYISYKISIRGSNLFKTVLLLLDSLNAYLISQGEQEVGFKDIEFTEFEVKKVNYKNFKYGQKKRTTNKQSTYTKRLKS